MTPFFYTQWHYFSLQSTLNDPLFSKFQPKISNFLRALIENFVNFSCKKANFTQFDQIFTEWLPILGSLHQKKTLFFESHTQWPPFFYGILHRIALFLFSSRHIPVTFIFEGPPPQGLNLCWGPSFFLAQGPDKAKSGTEGVVSFLLWRLKQYA